jgi:hypothetical protein
MGPPEGMGVDSVRIEKKPAPFPVQAPKSKTLTPLVDKTLLLDDTSIK